MAEIRATFNDQRLDQTAPRPTMSPQKSAIREQMQRTLFAMDDEVRKGRAAGTLMPEEENAFKLMLDQAHDAGIIDRNQFIRAEDEAVKPTINPLNPGFYMGGGVGALPTLTAEMAGQRPGEAGAVVGEIAGQTAAGLIPGGGLVRGIARPLVGALGAGLGFGAEKTARGLPVTGKELRNEALLSAIPQVAEEGVRAIIRLPLRRSFAGRTLRGEEASRQLKRGAKDIFQPPGSEVVSGAYQKVGESRMPVYFDQPDSPVREFFNNLRYDDVTDIQRRMKQFHKAVDAPGLSDKEKREVAEDLFNSFTASPGVGGKVAADIGVIDQFRQFLNKETRIGSERQRALMEEFKVAVDDLKDRAMHDPRARDYLAQTTNMTPEDVIGLLNQARKDHFVNVSAEHFNDLIERPNIMRSTEDGRFMRVHLGNLRDAIERPQSALAQDVVRRMEKISGAGERFQDMLSRLQQQFRYIEVQRPMRSGPISTARREFGTVLLTPLGRALFEKAITQGRGRVSMNTLATIANVVRRQIQGDIEGVGEQIGNPLATIPSVLGSGGQGRQQTPSRETAPGVPEEREREPQRFPR